VISTHHYSLAGAATWPTSDLAPPLSPDQYWISFPTGTLSEPSHRPQQPGKSFSHVRTNATMRHQAESGRGTCCRNSRTNGAVLVDPLISVQINDRIRIYSERNVIVLLRPYGSKLGVLCDREMLNLWNSFEQRIRYVRFVTNYLIMRIIN